MRHFIAFVLHAYLTEHVVYPFLDLAFLFPSGGFQHEFQILGDGTVGQLLEILEDDT